MKRLRAPIILIFVFGLVWACPFDQSIRSYLSASFWMPFVQHAVLTVPPQKGNDTPFAGRIDSGIKSPLQDLRNAYPDQGSAGLLAAARSSSGLTPEERDEIELLDAKFDLRADRLEEAKGKLRKFLSSAKTKTYRSEARGWLAHVHYRLGEQSAAGKIYLDELRDPNSNLSPMVLENSLSMVYGYNGGRKLREQIGDYFDSAYHAAFAIRVMTNPKVEDEDDAPIPYERVKQLLEKHSALLKTRDGADLLGALSMRVALRAGDPEAALRLAAVMPPSKDPEVLWMLGSAKFLTKDFDGAAVTLKALRVAPKATPDQKAAAMLGLVGAYAKAGNRVEQIRWAVELEEVRAREKVFSATPTTANMEIYWSTSGYDKGFLLDIEASIEELQAYLDQYPKAPGANSARYALGVRLAREQRFDEAATMYTQAGAPVRARRMRELAALAAKDGPAAKLAFATYLNAHNERVYFNDRLWSYFQSYVYQGHEDTRLDKAERDRVVALERKLRDSQEELWHAQAVAHEVVLDEQAPLALRQEAARLVQNSVRRISSRFGREKELRQVDIEVSRWLARLASPGSAR